MKPFTFNFTHSNSPIPQHTVEDFGRSILRHLGVACLFAAMLFVAPAALAQQSSKASGKEVYDQIRSFRLGGGSASVSGLVLNRDRVRMTFTGTLYFATSVEGRVTGAVFVGDGMFTAPVPTSGFEKENVKRLLGTDVVASDFKTAVLRFSDDTFEQLGQKPSPAPALASIQKLANDWEARILKQTGANLSARIALSVLNKEKPGFFFAHFDGGKRGEFSFLLDYQNRVPVSNFGLNAGEKGMILDYYSQFQYNETLMAFSALEDYQRGIVTYSDLSDLLDIEHYDMDLDLREPRKLLRLQTRVVSRVKSASLLAVPFVIGESLSEWRDERLKNQMRLKSVRLGKSELAFAQEDWEGGFTVFLPAAASKGQTLELEMSFEGDSLYDPEHVDAYYPLETVTWYPRHGYLDRATFDLTFRHPKKLLVATGGSRLSEEADPESAGTVITKYRLAQPGALITFALGAFERNNRTVKWEDAESGDPIPLEFSSLPRSRGMLKAPFVMDEMDISLRYFAKLFGSYPYPTFNAAFHPRPFAQGFPSLLLLPTTNWDDSVAYSLIAHETAHQWWGDIVTWRSYRDQWLSEGFAEYSAILYIGPRAGYPARDKLIDLARESLLEPVRTISGKGKGRLVDVGPISLGYRLETSKTLRAYSTLIYNKGALVLRMLHFLFTDPATSNSDPFFAMMRDFVNRYRNDVASTDDFRMVANEHFIKTQIAQTYGITNLDWFFNQWVHSADLPKYRMEYELRNLPDGKVVMTGSVTQEEVPNNWVMILPVKLSFGEKRIAYTTVAADGPKTSFTINLPARPDKVELDPQHWVLSEKTTTKAK